MAMMPVRERSGLSSFAQGLCADGALRSGAMKSSVRRLSQDGQLAANQVYKGAKP